MTAPTLTTRYRQARRGRDGFVVLDGFHAIKHAIRFGADIVAAHTRDPDALGDLAAELAPDIAQAMLALAEPVSAETFAELSTSPHPTGVAALARRPGTGIAELLAAPGGAPIVLLEQPTDHGNIGAVVRVAAAASAAGVLVTGPHDPWHASSIRGGAGLQFALPVMAIGATGVESLIRSDRPVVALDPGGRPLRAGGSEIPARAVLVFGSERSGVSKGMLDRADAAVSIPMRAGVSSLNLATAVAVALYALR